MRIFVLVVTFITLKMFLTDANGLTLVGATSACASEEKVYSAYLANPFYVYAWFRVTNGIILENNSTEIESSATNGHEPTITVRWNNQNGIQGKVEAIGYWNDWPYSFSTNKEELYVDIGSPPIGQFTAVHVAPCSESSSAFSVAPITGATSYSWSNTLGWSTASTGATATFTATTSTTSGTVSVTAINANCSVNSTRTISVSRDATIPFVEGDEVVPPNNNETFITVRGSNFYWTPPSGWTTMGSQGNYFMQIQAPSYSSAGYVSVTYVDACGVSGETSKFVSTEPYEEDFRSGGGEEELLVFPNPTSNYLFVRGRKKEGFAAIIRTEYGELIQQTLHAPGETNIDVSKLAEGRYFVQITSGEKTKIKRLVVKRN
jgi:hypothetical protein